MNTQAMTTLEGYTWKLDESGDYWLPDIELLSPDGVVVAGVDAQGTGTWHGWRLWFTDERGDRRMRREAFSPSIEAAKEAAERAYLESTSGGRLT